MTDAVQANSRPLASGYLKRAVLFGVFLVVLMGWLWWRGAFLGEHDVDARVTFVGREGTDVQGLRLIAGADKAYWPVLKAGETAQTRLFTGGEDTRLTMRLTVHGDQVSWNGPMFPLGAGYRIAIQVDSAGHITEKHCLLPCSMW